MDLNIPNIPQYPRHTVPDEQRFSSKNNIRKAHPPRCCPFSEKMNSTNTTSDHLKKRRIFLRWHKEIT